MRRADFYKARREYDTKRARESYADFQSMTVGRFEIQTFSDEDHNAFLLRVYRGKAGVPFQYFTYRSIHQRDSAAERMIEYAESDEKEQAERAAKKKEARATGVNPFKVGDLFWNSYGYDMTIVEFFEVTRVTKRGVYLRQICGEVVDGHAGYSGTCKPVAGKYVVGAIDFFKPLVPYGDGSKLGLSGVLPVDGKEKFYFNRMD